MIRICICDDKIEDINKLMEYSKWFIKEHSQNPVKVQPFESPYDLLQAISEHGGFDLYILDIIMPHLNRIDIARKIRERGEKAEILFLTTSREYAVEAFDVKASGYLIKPVKKSDFEREVLGCINNLSPKENPSIMLKTKYGMHKANIKEIVTVESFNHSRVCTLADGTVLETAATLSSLYEQLRQYQSFFIPHRAYIVNLEYVNGLATTELTMADGRHIPISRKIYPKLKQAYIDYTF